MRAAQIVEFGRPLEVRDVPDPKPRPGEAVVKIEAEGVCRTDWHVWQGEWGWMGLKPTLPRTPGHELSGVIAAVGEGVMCQVGDRVTVTFHDGCGECRWCLAGRSNICVRSKIIGVAYDGGYAEMAVIPNADFNLVPLPDEVGFDEAAALGCRYMTAFHAVVDQGRVGEGTTLAVHGVGGVGLSAVQVAAARGAHVIAVDIDTASLDMATIHGAADVIDASDVDSVSKTIRKLTDGGVDVSIDALGIADTCRNSILSLRRGGRHVQVGLTSSAEEGSIAVPVDIMVSFELEFVGSVGNPRTGMERLMTMVADGSLDPSSLITSRISLDEAADALASMTSFGTRGFTIIDRFGGTS